MAIREAHSASAWDDCVPWFSVRGLPLAFGYINLTTRQRWLLSFFWRLVLTMFVCLFAWGLTALSAQIGWHTVVMEPVECGYLVAVGGATSLPTPRSDDSAAACSSDTKCLLSSQLTSISGGRSPICHLGRWLIAGSSAPPSVYWKRQLGRPGWPGWRRCRIT